MNAEALRAKATVRALQLPGWVWIATALALFAFAAVTMLPRQNWFYLRDGLAPVVVGIALLLRAKLVKDGPAKPTSAEPSDAAIRFMGYDTNLAVVQVILSLLAISYALEWQVEIAIALALAIGALALLLRNSSKSWLTGFLGFLAFAYLLFLLAFKVLGGGWYILRFMARQEARLDSAMIPIFPFVLVIIAVIIAPQLQMLRWGKFRVGSLRGDFSFNIFGSPVTVALGSSILLVSIFHTLYWAAQYVGVVSRI